MTDSYWEEYARTTQTEGGGGGVVAECIIESGYKAYVGGPQEDSWFPAPAGETNKEAREAVKDRANAYAKAGGQDRARWGIQIRALRDGAYSAGKPVTWQGDRFWSRDGWTEDPNRKGTIPVLVPSLQENGIVLPYRGWCRLGFMNDPVMEARGEAGMTKKDQEGNPAFPTVTYVTEVFADQDAAYAALGITEAAPASAGAPTGAPQNWDEATWASVVPDIKASDKPPKVLADEYGVTVADIVRARM